MGRRAHRRRIISRKSDPCPVLGGDTRKVIDDFYSSPEPAWAASTSASEDCLFLNIWAPENATDLPVFVWIRELYD